MTRAETKAECGRLTRQEGRKDAGAVLVGCALRDGDTELWRNTSVCLSVCQSVCWEELCALLNFSALKSRELGS